MANFIQLDFKNAQTGAAINTIYLDSGEVPAGIKRNEDAQIVAEITTMGKARTFTRPDGIYFSFDVVFDGAVTSSKLDLIQTYIKLGYIVNVKQLSGSNLYASGTDGMVYSLSKAVIQNAVIEAFDNSWRQMLSGGLRSRVVVPITIRQGGAFTLPTAAQWIGN